MDRVQAKSVAISLSTLVVVTMLPLEGSKVGLAWRIIFFLKIPLAALALSIPLSGLGILFQKVIWILMRSPDAEPDLPVLDMMALIVAGTCLAGWAMMLVGWFLGVHAGWAWLILSIGYGCFYWGSRRPPFSRSLEIGVHVALVLQRHRWLAGAVLLMVMVNSLNHYRFHVHGDGYLYHLALSDNWITRGRTGVILSNIYSGYALSIEHFYLLLRLVFRGVAEQNALAQFLHFFSGFGLALAAVVAIFRQWMSAAMVMVFVLIALQSDFVFYPALPKNDGFVAGICLAALAFLKEKKWSWFLLMATVAFAVKLTAAFWFGVLGVVYLLFSFWQRESLRKGLWLQFMALIGMIGFWYSGFGLWNSLVTHNPLFPFLNELFPTPYARSFTDVITEMEPFQFSWGTLFRSAWVFLMVEPLVLVGLLVGLAQWGRRLVAGAGDPDNQREKQWVSMIILHCVLLFVVLQLVMGPYTDEFPSRHYLPIHLIFTILSVIFLVQACWPWPRARTAALVLLAGWGISRSHSEVKLMKFYESLQHISFIDHLRAMKPAFALMQDFANQHSSAGTDPIRLLDTTPTRQRMLVGPVEVYHPVNAYPIYKWIEEGLVGEMWNTRLASEGICYILSHDSRIAANLPSINLGSQVLSQQGRYRITLNPACDSP